MVELSKERKVGTNTTPLKVEFAKQFCLVMEAAQRWQWCMLTDDLSATDCFEAFQRSLSVALQLGIDLKLAQAKQGGV